MLRKLLTVVLPFALPIVVYWVYLVLARRKARLKAEGRLPGWQDAPWGWILLAGVVLMVASLGYWRETSGVDRAEPFLPPLTGEAPVVEAPVEPGAPSD